MQKLLLLPISSIIYLNIFFMLNNKHVIIYTLNKNTTLLLKFLSVMVSLFSFLEHFVNDFLYESVLPDAPRGQLTEWLTFIDRFFGINMFLLTLIIFIMNFRDRIKIIINNKIVFIFMISTLYINDFTSIRTYYMDFYIFNHIIWHLSSYNCISLILFPPLEIYNYKI